MKSLLQYVWIGTFLAVCSVNASCANPHTEIPTKAELISNSGFVERIIETEDRKIHFYQKNKAKSAGSRLILYLQGSDPSSQFSYRKTEDGFQTINWMPGDHRTIGESDVYIVVEKPGFEGVFPEEIESIPEVYHALNSLDDRVARADAVLQRLTKEMTFEKVIVYGHSEGAPVAAKLATVNEEITHLGFWAGNALPDFFDFALQSRIAVHAGEMNGAEAQEGISEMLDYVANVVAKDPEGTEVDDFGYTNKRWFSYSEPPINHLLQLSIPVFVQVATDDESAPIESSYLIPLEFARLGKDNLSYNVCNGCDHGFNRTDPENMTVREWPAIFAAFMEWVEEEN